MAGHAPGGGGGGGAFDTVSGAYHGGFPGGAGKVELVYTPAAAPANNVVRFLLFVPKHGGDKKPVPVRAPARRPTPLRHRPYPAGGEMHPPGDTTRPGRALPSPPPHPRR